MSSTENFPLMNQSKISDVDAQIKYKKDPFIAEVAKVGGFHKSALDGCWALSASEASCWPPMKAAIDTFHDQGDEDSFVEFVLSKHSTWTGAVRPSAIKCMEDSVTNNLSRRLVAAGFKSEDDSSVVACRSLLTATRRALSMWNADVLQEGLRAATDFSAGLASKDMKQRMIDGSAALTKLSNDKLGDGVPAFRQALPTELGVKVILHEEGEAEPVVKALEKLTIHSAPLFPAFKLGADTAKEMLEHVEVRVPEQHALAKLWTSSAELSSKGSGVYLLKEALDEYLSLASAVQERVDKDENLTKMKQVLRARKVVAPLCRRLWRGALAMRTSWHNCINKLRTLLRTMALCLWPNTYLPSQRRMLR